MTKILGVRQKGIMQISEDFESTGGMKVSRLKSNAGISNKETRKSSNQQENNPIHITTPSRSVTSAFLFFCEPKQPLLMI
jgi:hypothetical protein